MSIPVPDTIHPPIQWVLRFFPRGKVATMHYYAPPSNTKIKNKCSYISTTSSLNAFTAGIGINFNTPPQAAVISNHNVLDINSFLQKGPKDECMRFRWKLM